MNESPLVYFLAGAWKSNVMGGMHIEHALITLLLLIPVCDIGNLTVANTTSLLSTIDRTEPS